MSAGQTVRVRFTRLGKREQVEATAVLQARESVAELVCRVAHDEARAELKGVPLRVRIVPPPVKLRNSGQYAFVEADMLAADGKLHPRRVGHGPVWVEDGTG